MSTGGAPKEFKNVCDKELNSDKDFHDVLDAIQPLSADWLQIAISLRLKTATIDTIKFNCKGNAFECLYEILKCWLKKDYDYEHHGVPCWRKVCVAVKKGGDSALANEIAKKHPVTEGTTHPLPATTAEATPHLLPATTEGTTPLPSLLDPPLATESYSFDGTGTTPMYATLTVQSNTVFIDRQDRETQDRETQDQLLSLKMNIQDLTQEFQSLFTKTREAIRSDQLHPIIKYFKENTALLIFETEEDPNLLEAKLDQIKDTDFFFEFLRKNYVSWFNYEPMKKIVEECLIEHHELRQKWSQYQDHLLKFIQKNVAFTQKNIKFITHTYPFGFPNFSEKKIVGFKFNRSHYTMMDLYVVQRQISSALEISINNFYFLSINSGCIELKYLIPDHFYSHLFPLNEKQLQCLSKLNKGITKVTCGDFVHNVPQIQLPKENAKSMSKHHDKSHTERDYDKVLSEGFVQLHISKGFSVYVNDSSSYFEENFLILEMIYKLKEDFVHAVRITSRFFDAKLRCHITNYIVMHSIDTIIPLKSIQAKEAIRREFEETETIKELFVVLFNYLSWFKYQIILELIDKYVDKNQSLKKTWSDYKKKLEDHFETSISITEDLITTQVDRDDYTEDDLHFFRKALPVKFKEDLNKSKRELRLRYIAACNPNYVPLCERNFLVVSRIYELRDEFDDALKLTRNLVNSEHFLRIIEYILTHFHALIGPVKMNNPATAQEIREEISEIREEISNVKSIKDLFIILQDKKYISWFNYNLIIKLVHIFLSKYKSLKRTWSAYEKKLKDYLINWGGLLRDADAASYGITDIPPGTRIMIAKVDRDDYTLDDLFFFRRAIPKGIDIPHYKIFFQFVT